MKYTDEESKILQLYIRSMRGCGGTEKKIISFYWEHVWKSMFVKN